MNFRIVVLVVSMSLSAGTLLAAPARVEKWDAGLNISGTGFTDTEFSDAVYVGGSINYNFNEWMAFGAQFGWSPSSIDFAEVVRGDKKKAADVHMMPVTANVTARAGDLHPNFVPYGVMGAGAAIVATDKEGDFAASIDEESGALFKIGGGIDWYFDKYTPWALNFEFAHYFTSMEIGAKSGDTIVDTVDMDFWLVGAGVKYLFD